MSLRKMLVQVIQLLASKMPGRLESVALGGWFSISEAFGGSRALAQSTESLKLKKTLLTILLNEASLKDRHHRTLLIHKT